MAAPVPNLPTKEALGRSEAFLAFEERLSRAAQVDRPVLLIGERGTGKELAAARLHYLSQRWDGPFVALNAAALAPSLVESELFGHEAGSFTGAARLRRGRFEAADGGTLFLDEIAIVPVEVQAKVLRVVEYGAFERVGGSEPVTTDVRMIGATNRNLAGLAGRGEFKRDLLDRLSFEVIFLPPLRERHGDVMHLANHFAARMAHELGRADIPEFAPEAAEALEAHDWPGNIRELKNVVERAVYRSEFALVTEIDFDPFDSPWSPRDDEAPAAPRTVAVERKREEPGSFREAMAWHEVKLLGQALSRVRHNQRRAAALLGLTYDQFRGLYRKHRAALDASDA